MCGDVGGEGGDGVGLGDAAVADGRVFCRGALRGADVMDGQEDVLTGKDDAGKEMRV